MQNDIVDQAVPMQAKPRPVAVPLSAASQPASVLNQEKASSATVASDVTVSALPVKQEATPVSTPAPKKVSLDEMQDDPSSTASALRPPTTQTPAPQVSERSHVQTPPKAPAQLSTPPPQQPRYDDVIAAAEPPPGSNKYDDAHHYSAHQTQPQQLTQQPAADMQNSQGVAAQHASAVHSLSHAMRPAVVAAVAVCMVLIVFAWLVYSKQ